MIVITNSRLEGFIRVTSIMNLGFVCENCEETVAGEEDYIDHLKLSHDIIRGFQKYIDRAYQIKREKSGANDTITLDEDENNHKEFDIDETYQNLLREKAEETIDKLFEPIKSLLKDNFENETNSTSIEKKDQSHVSITDEELRMSLQRMKDIINQTKLTDEDIQAFLSDSETSPFKHPSIKVAKREKALKTESDGSTTTSSSHSSGSSKQSQYQCPLQGCNFKISKKQMKERENAYHLQSCHNITQKMYDSDREAFNFRKI